MIIMFKSNVVIFSFVVCVFLQVFMPCCDALKENDTGVCLNEFPEIRHRTRRIPKSKRCRAKWCIITETYQVTVNKTSCCHGWQWQASNDTCTPLCKLGCENGTCIAPEVCRCDPPLILKKNVCLLPVCDPPCSLNSRCTATNTCSCDENFFSINATYCAPICLTGFFNDPIECKPKCDKPCVSATCTAHNTCTCIEGHRMIDKNTCVPDCSPSCENADCVAPNTCKCHDGFKSASDTKCIPKCDRCENGDCIAPNKCKCHEGYDGKGGNCTPVCEQPCNNGLCSEPNTCSCNSGYSLDPVNKFNCLPICEPKCHMKASCVSPNTCSCLNGYYMTGNNWTCSPICDTCENGECVAPNTCRCDTGYAREGNTCRPLCEKPCKNGICSKPNACSCDMGYEVDKMDKFNCKPICSNDCVNSTCISPGKCQCLPGYESTDKDHICKPKCVSCINGQCVAPDVCECNRGYRMSNDVCLPICSSPCVNGHCSSPETCNCEEGFKRKLDEPHICYKECVGLCNKGECTLQGECICELGFDLVNDTCVEKESVDCNTCESNCTDSKCWCEDRTPCLLILTPPDEVASTTSLASLELTWILGGAVGTLLLILLMAIMIQMSRKRQGHENKTSDNDAVFGSVVYTVPDTLMSSRPLYETDVVQEDSLYEMPSRYREDEEYDTHDSLLNTSH